MTLYQSFKRYLEKEGYSVDTTQNPGSLILFKKEGLYYAFTYNDSSPSYFRLLLPNIWKCEELEDTYYKRLLEVSATYKVGKLCIIDNYLWASFEQIILDPNAENCNIYKSGIIILEMMFKEIKEIINTLPKK